MNERPLVMTFRIIRFGLAIVAISICLALHALAQTSIPKSDFTPITNEAAIGRGYLPLCLPDSVRDIVEKHEQHGAYFLGQGSFSFSPSDFPNLVRPWMPNGNASMGALRFENNPSTEEGMKLESTGYFFYRKEDVGSHWLLAANPVTGRGLFWFKHWPKSPDFPPFSNTDYTRSFRLTEPLAVRAFFQVWHNGNLQKETVWESLDLAPPWRRIDFEFIEDSEALVPVEGDYAHQKRDYAVIMRFYREADPKPFNNEIRNIIPSFDWGNGSSTIAPYAAVSYNQVLESRPLTPNDLLGKDIPIYKSDFVSNDKKEKFTAQLVLRFSRSSQMPNFKSNLPLKH